MRKINLIRKLRLSVQYPATAVNFLIPTSSINPRIKFIAVYLTEKCNLCCPGCYNAESRKNINQEINFDKFKVLIESLANKPALYFTGGEPTLNTDWSRILNYANDRNFITGMTTNGIILDQIFEDVVNSGLKFLSVSLDGFEKEHDKTRGFDGGFRKTVNGIKKLIEYRNETHLLFPSVKVNFTINKNNYLQIYSFVNDLISLGIDEISIQHFSFFSKEFKNYLDKFNRENDISLEMPGHMIPDKEYFTEKQTEEIIKQLDLVKKLNFNIDLDKPSCNNLYAYYAGEFPSRNSKCESIYNSIVIRGNGSIHICSDYGYEIGRIGKTYFCQRLTSVLLSVLCSTL